MRKKNQKQININSLTGAIKKKIQRGKENPNKMSEERQIKLLYYLNKTI